MPGKENYKVSKYLSLVKFSHTIFAMPFALIGYFLANNHIGSVDEIKVLLLVILCMIFARNAAMGFNRYADRHIDSKNPRTAQREIPAGKVKVQSALWFVIINIILFVGTTYFINPICFYLSPVALVVVLGYSYTKKFTALCHFILGIGLSLSPIGAYLAVKGEFALLPILFSLVVFFWVSGFDIIYALQDELFDKKEQLKSVPVFIGKKKSLLLSIVLHFSASLLVVIIGINYNFGFLYMVGAILFISLLIYQHILVKQNSPAITNIAFTVTNGLASVLFAVFIILDIVL